MPPQGCHAGARICGISRLRTKEGKRSEMLLASDKNAVRALGVIFISPRVETRPRLPQIPEPAHVQTFITKFSVEALPVRILQRLVGLNTGSSMSNSHPRSTNA